MDSSDDIAPAPDRRSGERRAEPQPIEHAERRTAQRRSGRERRAFPRYEV